MNPKLQEFLRSLLEGTQTGTFTWSETAEPGVYRLMLDKGLVRIYRFGSAHVGCTMLDAKGETLHDVQIPRTEEESLIPLYNLVDGSFHEGALDDLLAEVRMKMQNGNRPVAAGQR